MVELLIPLRGATNGEMMTVNHVTSTDISLHTLSEVSRNIVNLIAGYEATSEEEEYQRSMEEVNKVRRSLNHACTKLTLSYTSGKVLPASVYDTISTVCDSRIMEIIRASQFSHISGILNECRKKLKEERTSPLPEEVEGIIEDLNTCQWDLMYVEINYLTTPCDQFADVIRQVCAASGDVQEQCAHLRETLRGFDVSDSVERATLCQGSRAHLVSLTRLILTMEQQCRACSQMALTAAQHRLSMEIIANGEKLKLATNSLLRATNQPQLQDLPTSEATGVVALGRRSPIHTYINANVLTQMKDDVGMIRSSIDNQGDNLCQLVRLSESQRRDFVKRKMFHSLRADVEILRNKFEETEREIDQIKRSVGEGGDSALRMFMERELRELRKQVMSPGSILMDIASSLEQLQHRVDEKFRQEDNHDMQQAVSTIQADVDAVKSTTNELREQASSIIEHIQHLNDIKKKIYKRLNENSGQIKLLGEVHFGDTSPRSSGVGELERVGADTVRDVHQLQLQGTDLASQFLKLEQRIDELENERKDRRNAINNADDVVQKCVADVQQAHARCTEIADELGTKHSSLVAEMSCLSDKVEDDDNLWQQVFSKSKPDALELLKQRCSSSQKTRLADGKVGKEEENLRSDLEENQRLVKVMGDKYDELMAATKQSENKLQMLMEEINESKKEYASKDNINKFIEDGVNKLRTEIYTQLIDIKKEVGILRKNEEVNDLRVQCNDRFDDLVELVTDQYNKCVDKQLELMKPAQDTDHIRQESITQTQSEIDDIKNQMDELKLDANDRLSLLSKQLQATETAQQESVSAVSSLREDTSEVRVMYDKIMDSIRNMENNIAAGDEQRVSPNELSLLQEKVDQISTKCDIVQRDVASKGQIIDNLENHINISLKESQDRYKINTDKLDDNSRTIHDIQDSTNKYALDEIVSALQDEFSNFRAQLEREKTQIKHEMKELSENVNEIRDKKEASSISTTQLASRVQQLEHTFCKDKMQSNETTDSMKLRIENILQNVSEVVEKHSVNHSKHHHKLRKHDNLINRVIRDMGIIFSDTEPEDLVPSAEGSGVTSSKSDGKHSLESGTQHKSVLGSITSMQQQLEHLISDSRNMDNKFAYTEEEARKVFQRVDKCELDMVELTDQLRQEQGARGDMLISKYSTELRNEMEKKYEQFTGNSKNMINRLNDQDQKIFHLFSENESFRTLYDEVSNKMLDYESRLQELYEGSKNDMYVQLAHTLQEIFEKLQKVESDNDKVLTFSENFDHLQDNLYELESKIQNTWDNTAVADLKATINGITGDIEVIKENFTSIGNVDKLKDMYEYYSKLRNLLHRDNQLQPALWEFAGSYDELKESIKKMNAHQDVVDAYMERVKQSQMAEREDRIATMKRKEAIITAHQSALAQHAQQIDSHTKMINFMQKKVNNNAIVINNHSVPIRKLLEKVRRVGISDSSGSATSKTMSVTVEPSIQSTGILASLGVGDQTLDTASDISSHLSIMQGQSRRSGSNSKKMAATDSRQLDVRPAPVQDMSNKSAPLRSPVGTYPPLPAWDTLDNIQDFSASVTGDMGMTSVQESMGSQGERKSSRSKRVQGRGSNDGASARFQKLAPPDVAVANKSRSNDEYSHTTASSLSVTNEKIYQISDGTTSSLSYAGPVD